MRRWCTRVSNKATLVIIALMACGGLAAGYARWMSARNQEPVEPPVLLSVLANPAEYTVQDGTIVHDDCNAPGQDKPNGPAQVDTPKVDTPQVDTAKVDTLNMREAYKRASQLAIQTQGKVFKATITPHWFDNNTRFWYRNDLKDGAREFILVDASKGSRTRAFDHQKLATALSKASGKEQRADRLPFSTIELVNAAKLLRFRAGGSTWDCDLTTYECTASPKEMEEESIESPQRAADVADDSNEAPWAGEAQGGAAQGGEAEDQAAPQTKKGDAKKGKFAPQALREARSPDRKWTAFTKDNNVYLRDSDDKEMQVTDNGTANNPFAMLTWAPDSQALVLFRTEPGDNKEVYMIESSPRDQLPARLHTRAYPRPGDKFALHEMYVVDLESRKPARVDVERIDFGGVPRLRWSKDGKHFTFEKTDRGHQRFRVIEVETRSGKTRNIIDEKADTFIWSVHPPKIDEIPGIQVRYLDTSNEILLASQRGWKHLYLVDVASGKVKQITMGAWAVRGIDRVDTQKRQIWFRGNGRNPDQDPYLVHYYRVNFDGTGLVALTEGNGNHSIQYSPDGTFLIDTYSRVDMPPVHELRRVSDGTLICKLEEADISALLATGWRAPEVFVAKGRDGKTDIWGIVCRPQNYDSSKKYPVIEYIYAGPQGSFTPKTFTVYRQMMALAELGFIVVQCDGMGTAHRSRAFHDVCWQNLADAGFPDRILWIKALAKKYAYIDITRVGIYGTSAGGQSSTGALLFHPEFYKVAVSACGCHDNRLDKSSWNEQWMGLMGPHYEKQSNATNAHKLQGKLLLIVGELDTNVPFESTMRVVDALIRAQKDFDLLVVPGMNHSDGGRYGERRRWDFFVRHLHGMTPPDRNGGTVNQ
jgi:dipeptidyl aminopeptidase/acylaminoacyl peptidase